MSFSLKVKEELAGIIPEARHCQIAELAAIISMCGHIYTTGKGDHFFKIISENRNVAIKSQILVKRIFGYDSDSLVRYNIETKNRTYIMSVMDSEAAIKILLATRIMDTDGSINSDLALVNTIPIQNLCCKRAFLRGAFLAGGSISDPEKSYHFEITSPGREKALQVQSCAKAFEIDARIVERRRYQIVYFKENSHIVDMLNVMGAHVSLLELENIIILKDLRNSVNRKVNCEAANLDKTVKAALKQIEDIRYIMDTVGLDSLDEGLAEVARVRMKYEDASLKDIGEMLTFPIGKSGVNHRLRKISQIADEIRDRIS